MSGQVIWCLGMYGSASTWLFNAVRQICEAAQTDEIHIHFASTRREFAALAQPDVIHLIKSHEIDDGGTIVELAARASRILMTVRDPRDAVSSIMAYHHHGFDKALALVEQTAQLCLGYARDRRVSLFRYETQFFEDPRTIQILAGILGLQLSDEVGQRIFNGLRRAEVEAYIASLPQRPGRSQDRVSGDLLDPGTQWHTHHAGRSGEIGRWRHVLSDAQVRTVQESLRGTLTRFGYADG